MCPSGRKDVRVMAGVAKFSKSPLFEIEEQVEDKKLHFKNQKKTNMQKVSFNTTASREFFWSNATKFLSW